MLALYLVRSTYFDFWCLTLNFQSYIIGKVGCWGKNFLEYYTVCSRSVFSSECYTDVQSGFSMHERQSCSAHAGMITPGQPSSGLIINRKKKSTEVLNKLSRVVILLFPFFFLFPPVACLSSCLVWTPRCRSCLHITNHLYAIRC